MKSNGRDIKKIIKKRIELKSQTKMGVRDALRRGGTPPRPMPVDLVSRGAIRRGILPKLNRVYHKKSYVDYDVVICIPSYNRYEKVKRLISQFHEQPTKYNFKIILLNDGSKSVLYDELIEIFPEIIYLKNNKPNGKVLHWYCYNQMWEHLKNIQSHAVLQMDDDFILSDNFLDTIIDLFFRKKEEDGDVMAIAPHLWSFDKDNNDKFHSWWKSQHFIDGIGLIDMKVIESMNYEMQPVDVDEVKKAGVPVRAWTQISDEVIKIRAIIYRTDYSLVYHDGNDDSKLHKKSRNGGGVYTQKYIGNL